MWILFGLLHDDSVKATVYNSTKSSDKVVIRSSRASVVLFYIFQYVAMYTNLYSNILFFKTLLVVSIILNVVQLLYGTA